MVLCGLAVAMERYIRTRKGTDSASYRVRAPMFRVAYPLLAALCVSYSATISRVIAE